MYDAQPSAAVSAKAMPARSCPASVPPIAATPAAAGTAHTRSRHDDAVTMATPSGPRNSSVTTVASGSRSRAR